MPWTMFFQMPTSYGNSCFTIRTLIPSGPSRYPPSVFARRSSVSCLSISQLSMVVTFVTNDQLVRRNMMDKANSVIELSTNSRNSVIISVTDGPRYYKLIFSKHPSKVRSIRTYTGEVPPLPKKHSSQIEQVLQIAHRSHRVEEKAHEMRERPMGNTIHRPRTMMIHLRNTPSTPPIRKKKPFSTPIHIQKTSAIPPLTFDNSYNDAPSAASTPRTADTTAAAFHPLPRSATSCRHHRHRSEPSSLEARARHR